MDDEKFMKMALDEARKAARRGEVPVGAVIADKGGSVLAADGNRCIELNDPAGHAEILVLRAAGKRLENYRLPDTIIYVTLEPCAMCATAMVHARVKRLCYGASDPKTGAVLSCYNIGSDNRMNHSFTVSGGVLAEESGTLLRDFFKRKRA